MSGTACAAPPEQTEDRGSNSSRGDTPCPSLTVNDVRWLRCFSSLGWVPIPKLRITRRTFIHRSCLTGAATVAQTFAWWPLINTIDVAYAADAAVQVCLDFRHPPLSGVGQHALRREGQACREGSPGDEPAGRLPDLRRRPGPARQSQRARTRGSALVGNQDAKGVHPGRARLVLRHGRGVVRLFDKPTGHSITRGCGLSGSTPSATRRIIGRRRR